MPRGGTAFFRSDTWHHVHAHGNEELRVLELYAPPPASGSSGAYARTKPYLEQADWRYGDDSLLGRCPAPSPRAARCSSPTIVWRRSLGVLEGIYASTEHLTAGVLELNPGEISASHAHGGDEVVYALEGVLHVRAFGEDGISVFELNPGRRGLHPPGRRARVPQLRLRSGARALRRRARVPAVTRAIGIDVGGTKIAAGMVDTATGACEARFERVTRPQRDAAEVLADCVAMAQRLAAGQPGTPIGMGVCELVDREGHTQSAQTLDWRALDLAAAFARSGRP